MFLHICVCDEKQAQYNNWTHLEQIVLEIVVVSDNHAQRRMNKWRQWRCIIQNVTFKTVSLIWHISMPQTH